MSLGSRLKERRLLLNLSRKEVSERAFITPQALANYENNISIPKFEILISLFDVLECDANYVYQDYLRKAPRATSYLTENEQDFLGKYRPLDNYGKSVAQTVVDALYRNLAKRGEL